MARKNKFMVSSLNDISEKEFKKTFGTSRQKAEDTLIHNLATDMLDKLAPTKEQKEKYIDEILDAEKIEDQELRAELKKAFFAN